VWMDAAMRETFIATIGAGDPHEPSQPDLRNEAREPSVRDRAGP
jgi:hypothetical protein